MTEPGPNMRALWAAVEDIRIEHLSDEDIDHLHLIRDKIDRLLVEHRFPVLRRTG